VFNINFGVYTRIECMNPDCKKPIRRRVRSGAELIATQCHECGYQYEIRPQENDLWLWEPLLEKIPCPMDGCSEVFKLSPKQLVPGTRLLCTACQRRFLIGLALFDGEELQDHEKDAHD
jgi:hypothetical protein